MNIAWATEILSQEICNSGRSNQLLGIHCNTLVSPQCCLGQAQPSRVVFHLALWVIRGRARECQLRDLELGKISCLNIHPHTSMAFRLET